MVEKFHRARRRRSGRIAVQVPIQVAGTDTDGRGFVVNTRTLVLSRFGAKILLAHGLVPDQEITLGCPALRKDAVARVVGMV